MVTEQIFKFKSNGLTIYGRADDNKEWVKKNNDLPCKRSYFLIDRLNCISSNWRFEVELQIELTFKLNQLVAYAKHTLHFNFQFPFTLDLRMSPKHTELESSNLGVNNRLT